MFNLIKWLIYLKNLTFLSLKITVDTLIDVRNKTSKHHFLKSVKINKLTLLSVANVPVRFRASIAHYRSRPTVFQLKGISDTISNWFENHQPRRTQISTVNNAPLIQNSNRMASRLIPERINSTPAIFQATSKLFGLQGCSDDKNWLDLSSIILRFVDFAVQSCFRFGDNMPGRTP